MLHYHVVGLTNWYLLNVTTVCLYVLVFSEPKYQNNWFFQSPQKFEVLTILLFDSHKIIIKKKPIDQDMPEKVKLSCEREVFLIIE